MIAKELTQSTLRYRVVCMKTPTATDAHEALSVTDEAVLLLKQTVDRQSSRIVLVWGAVYLLAPLAMHFWAYAGFFIQQILLISAIVYTIYDSCRRPSITGPNNWRVAGVWWMTFAFGWAWFLILNPTLFNDVAANGLLIAKQMWAYGVSLAMFVYVLMGLWLGRLYVITGITVTALTVVGLLLLGDWYWLWTGLTGGGTLIIAGLILRLRNPK